MPIRNSVDIKTKAIKLRRSGESYSSISTILGISKSTLSDWLKNIPYIPNDNTLDRIKNGPRISALKRHQMRVLKTHNIYMTAINDVGRISDRDLDLFGLGLYLGEGARSTETVRLINSNPEVIILGIEWLKRIYKVETINLRLYIHTYPDTDIEELKTYWSRLTSIPRAQFGKIQVDGRLNKSVRSKNKLPFGTVQLRVVAGGNSNFGVSLHRRILASIEAVILQVNKRD